MRDNWLDDGLNEMFEDFDSEMNLEAEWAALEQRRETQQRPYRLWLLCMCAVVLGAALYLYPSTDMPADMASDTPEATLVNVIDPKANDLDLTPTQPPTQPTLEIEEARISENNLAIQNSEQQQQQQTLQQPLQQLSKQLDAVSTIKPRVDDTKTQDAVRLVTTQTSKEKTHDTVQSDKDQLASSAFTTVRENTTSINENTIAQRSTPNPNNSNQPPQTVWSSLTPLLVDQVREISILPSMIDLNRSVVNVNDLALTPSRTRKKANKAGAYYLGLDFGYSPLTSGGILADEIAVDGIGTSLYIKKYLASNIYLKTGLNLDRYTTQVNGTSTNSYTQIQDNQIIERYFNPDGTFVPVLGMGPVAIDEVTDYQLYNRYQFVSVPVIFGVQLLERANSFIVIEGGLSATIATQYEAKFFDRQSGFVEYDDLTIRKQGLLSGLGGISWHYQPQSVERLSLYTRLRATVQLNDTTTDAFSTASKFQSYSVGVGVEYRL